MGVRILTHFYDADCPSQNWAEKLKSKINSYLEDEDNVKWASSENHETIMANRTLVMGKSLPNLWDTLKTVEEYEVMRKENKENGNPPPSPGTISYTPYKLRRRRYFRGAGIKTPDLRTSGASKRKPSGVEPSTSRHDTSEKQVKKPRSQGEGIQTSIINSEEDITDGSKASELKEEPVDEIQFIEVDPRPASEIAEEDIDVVEQPDPALEAIKLESCSSSFSMVESFSSDHMAIDEEPAIQPTSYNHWSEPSTAGLMGEQRPEADHAAHALQMPSQPLWTSQMTHPPPTMSGFYERYAPSRRDSYPFHIDSPAPITQNFRNLAVHDDTQNLMAQQVTANDLAFSSGFQVPGQYMGALGRTVAFERFSQMPPTMYRDPHTGIIATQDPYIPMAPNGFPTTDASDYTVYQQY